MRGEALLVLGWIEAFSDGSVVGYVDRLDLVSPDGATVLASVPRPSTDEDATVDALISLGTAWSERVLLDSVSEAAA